PGKIRQRPNRIRWPGRLSRQVNRLRYVRTGSGEGERAPSTIGFQYHFEGGRRIEGFAIGDEQPLAADCNYGSRQINDFTEGQQIAGQCRMRTSRINSQQVVLVAANASRLRPDVEVK